MNLVIENKLITPGVINLTQFTSGTDILTFELDDYNYEGLNFSTNEYKAYAVAILPNGRIMDKVELTKAIADNKLTLTWHVTDYTTQEDGTLTYQIIFENSQRTVVWYSNNAIMFVNSSIDADENITANYPTLLQQWELRMEALEEAIRDYTGIPVGGTAGQVLIKNSSTDFDTSWLTIINDASATNNQTYSSNKIAELLNGKASTSQLADLLDDDTPSDTHTYSSNKINDLLGNAGYGDMLKIVYDTNNDGVVDNADKLNGQNASYYLNYNNLSNTPSIVTTENAGLMSAADKIKLNGIATGANAYILPTASSTLGGVKTTSAVSDASGYTACPIIAGVPYYKDTNTTYSVATTSQSGLMSSNDKLKLNEIQSGAQVNTITGIKGNAESTYRTGKVNITPANIGALPLTGGTITGGVTFNSSVTTKGSVELFGSTPFMDFHFGNTTSDYNARIINSANGLLDLIASNNISLSCAQAVIGNGGTSCTNSLKFKGSDGTYEAYKLFIGNSSFRTNVISQHWGNDSKLHVVIDSTDMIIDTYTTSDERLKEDIADIDEKLFIAMEEVELKQFVIKDSIVNPNKKISIGVIAQDIERAFEKYDIDFNDYVFLFKETKYENDDTQYYIVDYSEFNCLKIAYLEQKNKQCKKMISDLQSEVDEIKDLMQAD